MALINTVSTCNLRCSARRDLWRIKNVCGFTGANGGCRGGLDARSGQRGEHGQRGAVSGAAAAVIPSGHVDAAGGVRRAPVGPGGTLVEVQLARLPHVAWPARASPGRRAPAPVQARRVAHRCNNEKTNLLLPETGFFPGDPISYEPRTIIIYERITL